MLIACASEPISEPAAGEILLAQPPSNWKQSYSLINDDTRLTDFVPESETANAWTQKLSFESHRSLQEIDPISIVMGDLESTSEVCEDTESFNLFSGLENNYPTTVRLTFCTDNAHSKQGEVTFTKVIQGTEFLYIIKLVRREPVFTDSTTTFSKEMIAAWSDYFGNIKVCDRSVDEQSCTR